MRIIIAFFCPWLGFLTMGKPGKAFFAFLMQCSIIGWPIAWWWAIISGTQYYAEKRTDRIVDAIRETRAPAAPLYGYQPPPPGMPPQYPRVAAPPAPNIMSGYARRSIPQPPNGGFETFMDHDDAPQPGPDTRPQHQSRPQPTARPEPPANFGDILGDFPLPRGAQGQAEPLIFTSQPKPSTSSPPIQPTDFQSAGRHPEAANPSDAPPSVAISDKLIRQPRTTWNSLWPFAIAAIVVLLLADLSMRVPTISDHVSATWQAVVDAIANRPSLKLVYEQQKPAPNFPPPDTIPDPEDALWRTIQNSRSISDFQNYISEYPYSRYRRLAEQSIKAIVDRTNGMGVQSPTLNGFEEPSYPIPTTPQSTRSSCSTYTDCPEHSACSRDGTEKLCFPTTSKSTASGEELRWNEVRFSGFGKRLAGKTADPSAPIFHLLLRRNWAFSEGGGFEGAIRVQRTTGSKAVRNIYFTIVCGSENLDTHRGDSPAINYWPIDPKSLPNGWGQSTEQLIDGAYMPSASDLSANTCGLND